ncbi:serine/threonine-protein kinase [Streptomyces sp. NPDC005070]
MQGLLLAGRYRLVESIGSGGMGRVWRAHDEVLHRAVAVKELTAALYVSDSERSVLLARTRAEARAAARINHSAVVTVHDVLDHDGRPWIVMELVEGESLADAVKERGRIEPREAARVGLWVLRALRAAHAAGVLHRDIKPGNVLLGRDSRVLLTDFGIAQIEGDTTITRTGEVVGSVDYLAPERVRGHDPGPASDLWALGATLYTAVEGRSPFRRTSPIGTMQAVVEEEPAAPVNAGALGPVLAALLRKDPAERPGSEQVERMLVDVAEGRPSGVTQSYAPTGQAGYDTAEPRTGTGTRAHTAATTPYRPVTIAPVAAPSKRHRLRTFALVVALATIVGGGVAVGLQHFGTGSPGGSASGSSTRSADDKPSSKPSDKGSQGAVPAGWEHRDDPVGFSVSLPKGWTRSVSIDKDGLRQVDFTPDKGKHLVRVAVDTDPDFSSSYKHMINLDENLAGHLLDYSQLLLKEELFRDQPGARWEYTWDALAKDPPHYFPGPYRAIDVGYMNSDGTEYAVYESSPAGEWTTTKEQFKQILRSFQEG